jgi:hypothetical protein
MEEEERKKERKRPAEGKIGESTLQGRDASPLDPCTRIEELVDQPPSVGTVH